MGSRSLLAFLNDGAAGRTALWRTPFPAFENSIATGGRYGNSELFLAGGCQ